MNQQAAVKMAALLPIHQYPTTFPHRHTVPLHHLLRNILEESQPEKRKFLKQCPLPLLEVWGVVYKHLYLQLLLLSPYPLCPKRHLWSPWHIAACTGAVNPAI